MSFFLFLYFTVIRPHYHNCERLPYIPLTLPSGYIANMVTMETGYGSLTCPWRITLPQGQKATIYLLDFSTPRNQNLFSTICEQYAIISEEVAGIRDKSICGGQIRESEVYTSRSNEIKIRIITRKNVERDQRFHFLLRYEGM